jgi:hypothetical protein
LHLIFLVSINAIAEVLERDVRTLCVSRDHDVFCCDIAVNVLLEVDVVECLQQLLYYLCCVTLTEELFFDDFVEQLQTLVKVRDYVYFLTVSEELVDLLDVWVT